MLCLLQAIHGVPALPPGLNPATWMLDISTPAAQDRLGVDLEQAFRSSSLARHVEGSVQKTFAFRPDVFREHMYRFKSFAVGW